MMTTCLPIARRDYARGVSAASYTSFDPSAFRAFQYTYRSLSPDGTGRLGYALDEIELGETFAPPVPSADSPAIEGLLDLLPGVAAATSSRAATPKHLVCEPGAPPLATARLLSALYSE